MKKIDNFSGDFEFLSNFSPHSFRDETETLWRTNEHFYQAWKTLKFSERGRIWSASTPGRAKKLGQEVTLRADWLFTKFDVMKRGLELKFAQNDDIRELLIQTDGYHLVEGNRWHDNIWGSCNCHKCWGTPGSNWLGILLMELRKEIIDGE